MDEKVKILLVDDIKDNLIALEGLLRQTGVEITKVKSGVEALGLMIDHFYALAIIDVNMPEMSGFELAELMRGTQKTKDIPIIFVTATAKDQSFSFKGYESGAVDFLLKPLDTHAVKSKVKFFIELYQQKIALKIAESKFRGLLETAPDAIVIVDQEGKIALINKQTETFFGYNRSELQGQPIEILIPESFRHAHVQHRQNYNQAPGLKQMGRGLELLAKRKDGSEFPVDISLSPLNTENGMLISASIRDISERRALEKGQENLLKQLQRTQSELELAVQMRDEFMSISSHELKTPLTSLMLQSQLRKRNLLKGRTAAFAPDELAKMFTSDENQLKRINLLIDDMLDVSRINSGKLSMRKEQYDLCDSIRDLVGICAEQFRTAGCPIQLDAGKVLVGCFDRFRIEQVVTNLLNNAMRYGEEKPITLTVTEEPGKARIVVQNLGRGIALVNHERIFQRFERDAGSEITGLGLGLYIVRQIVEAHQGTIHVESALGEGASFVVELPMGFANSAQVECSH